MVISFPVFASGQCNCNGYAGPGGPCYAGPGGACYAGPGGPYYAGPGGPLYNPGGCNAAPGGPCYAGPGGPLYAGPGGPLYAGPGGAAQSNNQATVSQQQSNSPSPSNENSGIDVGFLVSNYQRRASTVEMALDNYRNAVRRGDSKREIERLYDNFISAQQGLKRLREESNRKGANISPDYYETVRP